MVFDKIIAPTPRELFTEQIVKKILSGELHIGEKLPTERMLADQMGLNRSAVHIALEDLERMGFVRIEQRNGAYIADYARDGDFNTLSAIARYSGGKFDPRFTVDLVELRNSIVGSALVRLAQYGSDEDFQELRAMSDRHGLESQTADDVHSTALRMLEFNMTLVKLAGNSLFVLLMNTLGPKCIAIWENCVTFWGVDSELRQEEMILSMLESGKGHDAALYLEKQFDTVCEQKGLRREKPRQQKQK